MSILYNYICPKNMQVSELQARVEQSRKPDGDMVEISGVGAPVFAETSEMPPVGFRLYAKSSVAFFLRMVPCLQAPSGNV